MNSREDTGQNATETPTGHSGGSCCGGARAKEAEGAHGCCGGGGNAASEGCCGGGQAAEQVLVFSRRQIRELDRLAVTEFGMPSILLMENAARGVAGVILEGLQSVENPSVLAVCGPGNNGGDGLAVARHLANRGIRVGVVLGGSAAKYTGDALTNLQIVQKMGVPIFEGNAGEAMDRAVQAMGEPIVVCDALLGTGLDRPASGAMAELIVRMNAMKGGGCTVVAIDVPSGLDCDSGEPGADASGSGPAVRADLTIALAGVKAGFMTETAQAHVGELVVVDIGAPRELVSRLGRPLGAGRGSGGGGCCQGSHGG